MKKKTWEVIGSFTDSLKQASFKIKLDYKLEKAFYQLYYDTVFSDVSLKKQFDEYELALLRNFIFAKHNYKFVNLFYQAYYNTFTFYNNYNWRKNRLVNVDKYLTKSDRENLLAIRKALR